MLNRLPTKNVFAKLLDEELDRSEADDADTFLGSHADSDTPADSKGDPGDDTASPQPDQTTEANTRVSKRWLRRLAIAVTAVAFLGTAGAAGFFGWQVKQQHDIDAASRAALEVARSYAVTLTSVDNAHIDDNFTQVLDGATGEFKEMYSQSAAQLRQLLIDNKAVSHGTVADAAVRSATKDKVVLMLFIDQSISNTVHPDPRIDRSRVTMTMELVDGRWLASKVDLT